MDPGRYPGNRGSFPVGTDLGRVGTARGSDPAKREPPLRCNTSPHLAHAVLAPGPVKGPASPPVSPGTGGQHSKRDERGLRVRDCGYCQAETFHIHASDLGGCLKSQIAAQLHMKPIPVSPEMQQIMDEGHLHEGDVIARLEADGYTVTRRQEELALDCGGVPLVFHPDGVVNGDPFVPFIGPRLLEVKAPGKAQFKEWQDKGWEAPGLWQKYKWQCSVGMHLTGLELFFAVKSRDSGALLRHGLEVPFHSISDITERVAYIEDHVARGQLPDECPHDFFCAYRYLCQKPAETVDTSDEFTADELAVLDNYAAAGLLVKQGKEMQAKYREQVEKLAGRTASGYRVQLITQNIKEKVVPASTRTMLRVTKLEDSDED